MNPRLRLRIAIVLPVLFGAVGATLLHYATAFHLFVSPIPAVAAALLILAASGWAALQLWRAATNAWLVLLAAGLLAFGGAWAGPWLIGLMDMVNATSEPLTWLEQHWYQLYEVSLVLMLVATCGASAYVRRLARGLA
ncbi:MAG TPA: hypothetical protein VLN49_03525 [Gemmatimonadaceae bacterium]|nr:hypothetical protein [Gemmatimonadaceae bacterium]